ncbi:MAG: hypothetical protein N2485_08425, partial [bacterium]|nr:hypothetical protein [bacterium]
ANTDEVGMDGVKTTGNVGSKYRYAFCIVLDNGKKAIGKVMMPSSLRKSSLFKTGVDTGIKGVE